MSNLNPAIIIADRLYGFDRSLWNKCDLREENIKAKARAVAENASSMI